MIFLPFLTSMRMQQQYTFGNAEVLFVLFLNHTVPPITNSLDTASSFLNHCLAVQ